MLPERCVSAPHPTSRRPLSLQPSSEPSCRPHPFHAPPPQPRGRPVCAPHHHARQRPPHPTRIRPPSRSRSAPRSLLHPHPVLLLSLLWQLPSLPRARPSLPAACPHLPQPPRPCGPRPGRAANNCITCFSGFNNKSEITSITRRVSPKNSSDLSSGRRPMFKSVDFSDETLLVPELQRCAKVDFTKSGAVIGGATLFGARRDFLTAFGTKPRGDSRRISSLNCEFLQKTRSGFCHQNPGETERVINGNFLTNVENKLMIA